MFYSFFFFSGRRTISSDDEKAPERKRSSIKKARETEWRGQLQEWVPFRRGQESLRLTISLGTPYLRSPISDVTEANLRKGEIDDRS